MKEIAISEFKAKCVGDSGGSIQNQEANSHPSPWNAYCGIGTCDKHHHRKNWFMKGKMDIVGDIISPATDPSD